MFLLLFFLWLLLQSSSFFFLLSFTCTRQMYNFAQYSVISLMIKISFRAIYSRNSPRNIFLSIYIHSIRCTIVNCTVSMSFGRKQLSRITIELGERFFFRAKLLKRGYFKLDGILFLPGMGSNAVIY